MRTDLAPEAAGRMRASILLARCRWRWGGHHQPPGRRIGARPVDRDAGLAQMGGGSRLLRLT